jgi:hypothetical protein
MGWIIKLYARLDNLASHYTKNKDGPAHDSKIPEESEHDSTNLDDPKNKLTDSKVSRNPDISDNSPNDIEDPTKSTLHRWREQTLGTLQREEEDWELRPTNDSQQQCIDSTNPRDLMDT